MNTDRYLLISADGHAGPPAAVYRDYLDDLAPLEDWVKDGAPGVFVVDAKICPDLEADYHKEM